MKTAARRALARKRLLQCVRVVEPRLLWLVAPAGWGKTTFAEGLLAKSAHRFLCDCRGVGDAVEFGRRIIDALNSPGTREQPPLQQSFPFGDDGADAPRAAVARWAQDCDPTTFVFDNAECLGADPALLDLLARLLRHPHPARRVVVATREKLEVPSSGFAPPNEVLSFSAYDLRFDDDEIRTLFGNMLHSEAVDPACEPTVGVQPERNAVRHIAEMTAGWPVAVLLLVRAAREGRLAAALTEMHEAPSATLTQYFAREVVERFAVREQDALIAAATFESRLAFPLRFGDVPGKALERGAGATAPPSFPALGPLSPGGVPGSASSGGASGFWPSGGIVSFPLVDTPFVTVGENGRTVVHPLIRALAAVSYGARARSLASERAERCRRYGESSAAARLYLWLGDSATAAAVLRDCPPFLGGALSAEVADVLAAFDAPELERHPIVWSAATFARVGKIDNERWIDECRRVYTRLPAAGSMRARLGVTCAYAYAVGMLGRFEEGHSALAVLLAAAATATPEERDAARAFATLWLVAFDLWRGEPVDLERLQRTIEPLLGDDALRALWSCDVLAFRCRMYGDRFGERVALEAAGDAAAQSALPAVRAFVRTEAAFGAWLAGEHDRFEQILAALEADTLALEHGDARFFVDCARGQVENVGPAQATPRRRCTAYLIAAAAAKDRKRAASSATAALEAADEARSAYHQVIARVALALVDEGRSQALLEEALRIAKEHRNFALEASLQSRRANGEHATMLTPLCKRFEHFRGAPSTRVSLSLAALTVSDGGDIVALSPRETAALARIVLASEPLRAHALGVALWPEQRNATAAAKVCVERLSRKLGEGAVLALQSGYTLGPEASVDLFLAEHVLRTVTARDVLTSDARMALERSRTALRPRFPAFALGWKWFEPYAERISTAYRESLAALAADALLRDDVGAATACAQELLAHDPCNEFGCEVVLTGARRRGDFSAALSTFRRYEAALRSELDMAPPERLRVLLRATLHAEGRGLRVV